VIEADLLPPFPGAACAGAIQHGCVAALLGGCQVVFAGVGCGGGMRGAAAKACTWASGVELQLQGPRHFGGCRASFCSPFVPVAVSLATFHAACLPANVQAAAHVPTSSPVYCFRRPLAVRVLLHVAGGGVGKLLRLALEQRSQCPCLEGSRVGEQDAGSPCCWRWQAAETQPVSAHAGVARARLPKGPCTRC
jgi:hypothetical protein